MQSVICKVLHNQPLCEQVHRIDLLPERPVTYRPGQYLRILLENGEKRPYSIASTCAQSELVAHVGAGLGSESAARVIEHCRVHGEVRCEIGIGDAYFQSTTERAVLLLAGGTGFAYAKSIADYLRDTVHPMPVYFYWGVHAERMLYADAQMREWALTQPHFHYIPVVEHPEDSWRGESGLVHHAAMRGIDDFGAYDIYLAGRSEMVATASRDFVSRGGIRERMFADAFAYL